MHDECQIKKRVTGHKITESAATNINTTDIASSGVLTPNYHQSTAHCYSSLNSHRKLCLQQSADSSADHNYYNSSNKHDEESSHQQGATLCSSFASNSESDIENCSTDLDSVDVDHGMEMQFTSVQCHETADQPVTRLFVVIYK